MTLSLSPQGIHFSFTVAHIFASLSLRLETREPTAEEGEGKGNLHFGFALAKSTWRHKNGKDGFMSKTRR